MSGVKPPIAILTHERTLLWLKIALNAKNLYETKQSFARTAEQLNLHPVVRHQHLVAIAHPLIASSQLRHLAGEGGHLKVVGHQVRVRLQRRLVRQVAHPLIASSQRRELVGESRHQVKGHRHQVKGHRRLQVHRCRLQVHRCRRQHLKQEAHLHCQVGHLFQRSSRPRRLKEEARRLRRLQVKEHHLSEARRPRHLHRQAYHLLEARLLRRLHRQACLLRHLVLKPTTQFLGSQYLRDKA